MAPLNRLPPRLKMPSVDEMSMQLKTLVAGSKMPTQSALDGAKTTRPSLAVVAPLNLLSPMMVDETLIQAKAMAAGSKVPTQSASYGAKTTRPLLAVVALMNLPFLMLGASLVLNGMLTQLKASLVGSKMPTQSASNGAKTTSPLMAVVAPPNFAHMKSAQRGPSTTAINGLVVAPPELESTAAHMKSDSLDSCRPRPEWMSACMFKGNV